MKNNVIFYQDWYEAIAELPPEERVEAYDAVFQYAFRGVTPTNKLIKGITALMRTAIDRDNAKYDEVAKARSEAGKKGMAKRWGNKDNNSYQTITNVTKITDKVKDKDKEKVKGKDKDKDKVKDKDIVYPYQDIVALWKELCPMLPQIKALSDNRRAKIKTRLHEFGNDPKGWLGFVRDLFARVAASSFLRGENKNGWVCTFDWLFENDKNWVKVCEGNYDDNRGSYGVRQQQQAALGVGEWIDEHGVRRYGTGKHTVPMDAPRRPGDNYYWSAETNSWITGV